MLATQSIRFRLALAIVLTALIPVSAAIVLSRSMVKQSSERFFVPEIRQRLEQSLDAYQELARVTKQSMRHHATAIAADPTLRDLVAAREQGKLTAYLEQLIQRDPGIVTLRVNDADGELLATAHRGHPIDPNSEHRLVVLRSLAASPVAEDGSFEPTEPRDVAPGETAPPKDEASNAVPDGDLDDEESASDRPQLLALFATSKHQFDEFEKLAEFLDAYAVLEDHRESVEGTFVLAFAALLGITIVLAVGVGTLLARGVASRVTELAGATRKVGAGDLTIRVDDRGRDEIAQLARAFNRMLEEVDRSRSRIEYLSRLASWQEMARRLAHEIKNPLTPIQLAMQEVHQRLARLGPEQKRFLDDALEIVESEVQSLRRLVGEFSEFARLPQSRIEDADLFQFLRDIEQQSEARPLYFQYEEERAARLLFEIPEGNAPVEIDTQMMRRVLVNLIRNAFQAVGDAKGGTIRVSVAIAADAYVMQVEDNGPGVPKELRATIFEPYVTTKDDGTGLGLAIVKKIIIDHGGIIEMLESDLGGARVRIQLPRIRGSQLTRKEENS